MRFKNEDQDLKLYAVSGTQTVLLSFETDKAKLDGKKFMGFSVTRRDADGSTHLLNGSKHFDSLIKSRTLSDPSVKFKSLVQSFFWKDYTADPGKSYTYTVEAMGGDALHYAPFLTAKIKVKTEPLHNGRHSVYFNYGVTGSQGYAKKKEFGNKPISELSGAKLQHALDYLGRELWSEGLLQFVQQAQNKSWSLYGAFYELQYAPFLKELKAAHQRGAQVEVVYSNQPGQNKPPKANGTPRSNREAITKAGIKSLCHPRTVANQPHNKFMVLCYKNKPVQVWTGSTNITIAGIFGQCNTGHWIEDEKLAADYFTYWTKLKENPALPDLSAVSTQIQADTDLTKLKDGVYAFFSPRDLPTAKKAVPVHLSNYAKLISSAKEMVCMIFPFNIDDVFKKVYQQKKDFLRLLIFEKAAEAASVKSKDVNLKITAGAVLDSAVENWTKEVSAKTTTEAGILYVHNKFFLVDPLGPDPVVVTGSANFSRPSMLNNDENSILVKGDARVADIYLTEFNRLFEHFWPRYLHHLHPPKKGQAPVGFEKPLDETYSWYQEYFDPEKYGCKRKDLFLNMNGVVKG